MTNPTIIIPVFEETQVLSFSNYYFDQLKLQPIYALDSKRISRRAEVQKLLGREVAIYENPGSCIEASYQNLAALSPTDWVLRIDCDEIPNPAMIAYCRQFANNPTDAYCGFDRDDLRWNDNRLEKVRVGFAFVDNQFRLFNRNKVKFVNRIHTPGFDVPKWKLPFLPLWNAPRSARIYHLQRPFLTDAERAKKIARYDAAGQDKNSMNGARNPKKIYAGHPFMTKNFKTFLRLGNLKTRPELTPTQRRPFLIEQSERRQMPACKQRPAPALQKNLPIA